MIKGQRHSSLFLKATGLRFREQAKRSLLLRKRCARWFRFCTTKPEFSGKSLHIFPFPGGFLKDVSVGKENGGLGWGGGKLGDLLSEWERRRPDTRERKRNRIHAVPRPHA